MKDYWLLIGITDENASDDQIRQAHFRTFRFYQGRKNESKNPAQRAVAELVIDYLRNAQHNQDLPLPTSLKHLLPPSEVQPIAKPIIPSPASNSINRAQQSSILPQTTPPNKHSIILNPTGKTPDNISKNPVATVPTIPQELINKPNIPVAQINPIPTAKPVLDDYVPPTEIVAAVKLNKSEVTSNTESPKITNQNTNQNKEENVPPTDNLEKSANQVPPPSAYVTRPLPETPLIKSNWGELQSLVDKVMAPVEQQIPSIKHPPKPAENIPKTEVVKNQPLPEYVFIAKEQFETPKKNEPAKDDDDDISLDPDFDNNEISNFPHNQSQDLPKEIFTEVSSSGRHLVIGDVINCPDCEWDILSQTDSYCSGCGKSITNVSVPKELIVYISDSGSFTKSFNIVNDGLIPIKIDSLEIIDIDATVEPKKTIILGKNESLQVNLQVSEKNQFGRRSGRLRFRYHDKPLEIPIQLKEPPQIQLTFPDVSSVRTLSDGFYLKLPISQPKFSCQIETNSESPLIISSITLASQELLGNNITITNTTPYQLSINSQANKDVILNIGFQELGSRRFLLKLQQVEVPNLIDQIERYNIGEQAIILGSGIFRNILHLKNVFDSITNQGKGVAQRISFKGAPSWLKLVPDTITQLNPNENCLINLEVDSNQITKASREYVQLELSYFDPQLICDIKRPQPIQLPFEFMEPKDYNDWIAIDFGTSNSCAAMIEGNAIRTLTVDEANFNPNPSESPTCIQFVDESNHIYECGMNAYTKRFSGQRAIKSTAWAFKPLLSRSYEPKPQTYLDIIHGKAHTKTVDELISIYAHSLLEAVKLRNGIAPSKAVVTFPVTFGKAQRERLATAFKSVGLEEVIVPISEPVALAIHYAYLHKEVFAQAGVFAVFDFGGGTTDLAIFQIQPATSNTKPQFHLLDVSGVDLGGELLTFELARFIYEQLVPPTERATFVFPNSPDDLLSDISDIPRENYRHLATFAEFIKRSFQKDETIFDQEIDQNLTSSTGNQTFRTKLSRKDIELLLKPQIEKLTTVLIDMVTALYERKLIAAKRLDWILLGGNSSRLPLVTEILAEAFFDGNKEKVLLDTENIKFGVTKGALLYAVAPEALPFPIDQVNHTLPCRIGLLAPGYQFDPIFERGINETYAQSIQKRHLSLPTGKNYFRLYYYFGHEANPKVMDNPKMKDYRIICESLSGQDIEVSFRLLPECAGIEVIMCSQNQEIKEIVPILGAG